ncbi:MAG: DUF465 domain-containing protein [Gammaproteobacteria bacterium]|nr:DUF465 domain-containing protein [Gammaproteobacteria bacterium]NND61051.1 DUF465 domain-containing protein [Gammaproteobacteria bacterium]
MYGQNHDIYHEFPEFADRIDTLKTHNLDFARLVDTYTKINREVIRIEQNIEPKDHVYFEELKKKRLYHKDLLYSFLQS